MTFCLSAILEVTLEQATTMEGERYKEKVKMLAGLDPYKLVERKCADVETCSVAKGNMPDIQYHDVYNYLINSKSAYTGQQLKAFKSLDAYKYFIAGFVNDTRVTFTTNGIFVIKSKVRSVCCISHLGRSQRQSQAQAQRQRQRQRMAINGIDYSH